MTRLILDIVAIVLGGAGGLAGLLTLRQRRQLLTAQADDVKATGQARIMDAAGRIVEQQADLVPMLLERTKALETREETRAAEHAAIAAELEQVLRYVDDAQKWMQQALRLVQELGGDMPAPPQPPARPAVFPRPKPSPSSVPSSAS